MITHAGIYYESLSYFMAVMQHWKSIEKHWTLEKKIETLIRIQERLRSRARARKISSIRFGNGGRRRSSTSTFAGVGSAIRARSRTRSWFRGFRIVCDVFQQHSPPSMQTAPGIYSWWVDWRVDWIDMSWLRYLCEGRVTGHLFLPAVTGSYIWCFTARE